MDQPGDGRKILTVSPHIPESQYVRDVVLLEARIGALVSKTTLGGESPRRCGEFEIVEMNSLGGPAGQRERRGGVVEDGCGDRTVRLRTARSPTSPDV